MTDDAHPRRAPEIRPLLEKLAEFGVRYIVTGSAALLFHGIETEPRDLDITPATDRLNLERLAGLLRAIAARPGDSGGRWEAAPDGEMTWVARPAGEPPRSLDEWTPDPSDIASMDHIFTTSFGDLDVVPRLAGTFESLHARAIASRVHGGSVLVAHPDDLLAALTVARREKDTRRVRLLRELGRTRGAPFRGSVPRTPMDRRGSSLVPNELAVAPSSARAPVAFDLRFEWGEAGLAALVPGARAVVIVDVLSFSTTVDVALSRGVVVHPWGQRDASAEALALGRNARLAGPRAAGGISLSPASFARLSRGTHVVLPSPNGARLCLRAASLTRRPIFVGCLRNASAVAAAVMTAMAAATEEAGGAPEGSVVVIAAGERWPDGSLRPALEDAIGAGAILHAMRTVRSPEATASVAAFESARGDLLGALRDCASGRELIEAGYTEDVETAGELDVSALAPCLREGVCIHSRDARPGA